MLDFLTNSCKFFQTIDKHLKVHFSSDVFTLQFQTIVRETKQKIQSAVKMTVKRVKQVKKF